MNDFDLKKKVVLISICILLLGVGIYFAISYYKSLEEDTKEVNTIKEEVPIKKETSKDDTKTIKVDIKGEVKNPNIYTMNETERIIDVITKAGGLTKKADTSMINLSKKLTDEMVIIIYSKEQVRKYTETKKEEQKKQELCNEEVQNDACIEENKEEKEQTSKININTATLEQLQTLPRIGEAKAKNILAYRKKNGGFKKIEEIKEISGIGESIFDQIKDYITI